MLLTEEQEQIRNTAREFAQEFSGAPFGRMGLPGNISARCAAENGKARLSGNDRSF